MKKELFSRTEFADIAGVHPLTIRAWEKTGKIQVSCYVGIFPRYSVEEISKAITETPVVINKETPGHE